jgi:hypothetical protein
MHSSASGRSLVCHASCVRNANGIIGNIALVIEPAKASEIAPIVTQAYEMSRREQEVVVVKPPRRQDTGLLQPPTPLSVNVRRDAHHRGINEP